MVESYFFIGTIISLIGAFIIGLSVDRKIRGKIKNKWAGLVTTTFIFLFSLLVIFIIITMIGLFAVPGVDFSR